MRDDDQTMKPAKKLFGYSIIYLFAIFGMLLIDRAIMLIVGGL
jgi:protoheme IX farnesyltransferase